MNRTIKTINPANDRLIRRAERAMLFWREKLMETTTNYRFWKKMVSSTGMVSESYRIIQTRRVKRIVAQAYVEYRRKQAELKALLDSAQESQKCLGYIERELHLRFANSDAEYFGGKKPA